MNNRWKLSCFSACILFGIEANAVDDLQWERDNFATTNGINVPSEVGSIVEWGRWIDLFATDNMGANSCGNFDPMYSVINSFKETEGRVKQMLEVIPDAIKGSINPTSIAAAALQRTSPQTYELIMNGIGVGFDEFNLARDLCERAQKALLDQVPEEEYSKVAKKMEFEAVNKLAKNGNKIDITKLFGSKSSDEELKGNAGLETPDGRKGGAGQPRLAINDAAKYGFESIMQVSGSGNEVTMPIAQRKPRSMKDYFKKGEEVTNYVTAVVGAITVATCEECPKKEIQPGAGIGQLIAETAFDYYEKLNNLLGENLNDITAQQLDDVSVYPLVIVTRSTLRYLHQTPKTERIDDMSALSYDLATAEHLQKIGYAKTALLAGMASPSFASNHAIQNDIKWQAELLEDQRDSIVKTNEAKKVLASGATDTIYKRRELREKSRIGRIKSDGMLQ